MNIKYTDNALIIDSKVTDGELKKEIKKIFSHKESLPWIVGDLLVFLQKRSQDEIDKRNSGLKFNKEHIGTYKSLLDADNSNKSYLRACKKVCVFFSPDCRKFPVPFSTYKEAVVLAKEVEPAMLLVEEAASKSWSYRELRKAFRQRQSEASGLVGKDKPNHIAETIKVAMELSRKLKGEFSAEERQFILKALMPVIKWAEEGIK